MTEQSTAALDQAAAEAVESESQEVVEETKPEAEEVQETSAEEKPAEDADAEELPKDHKERSDLGRKVSAIHRRMDEIDNMLGRLSSFIESGATKRDEDPSIDPNEPLTYSDWKRLSAEQKHQEERAQKEYDDKYRNAVSRLGQDLTDSEWTSVIEEMKAIPLNSSGNPDVDAERNFYKAERIYLRKQMAKPAEKKNPLKGEAKVNTGVATSQKPVVKEAKEPELDSYAQSYYDYVKRTDGEKIARDRAKGID